MKIECSWSREDLKNYLKKKRRIPNLIFLVLGTYFFFDVIRYGLHDEFIDKVTLLVGFAIYFLLLIFLLWFVTKLYVFIKLHRNDKKTDKAYGQYCIEANEEKIVSATGNIEISYAWKDISTYKIRKNYFFLRTKQDKVGLCFRREILKNDYDALLSYVKKQLSI